MDIRTRQILALGIMNIGSAIGGFYLLIVTGNVIFGFIGTALSALAAYASKWED